MSQASALIVTVAIRREGDVYSARSDDLPGLFVNGDSLDETCDLVAKAIKALFKHSRKLDVDVIPVSDADTFPAIPSHCDRFVVQRLAA